MKHSLIHFINFQPRFKMLKVLPFKLKKIKNDDEIFFKEQKVN